MFYYPNKPIRTYSIENVLPIVETWFCQAKMNGKRVLPFFDGRTLTLFGRQGQKFKEYFPELKALQLPTPWLLDGELLRSGRIFLWDYAVLDGKLVSQTPYHERWKNLNDNWRPMDTCALVPTVLSKDYKNLLSLDDPELEGLVWKDPKATNLWGLHSTSEVSSQVKWRKK
jgi:ATP-dependent DNA ligase